MKFKIVVVGCGSMSRIWVRYVQSTQDAEIVALVDIHPQATTRLAEEFGLTCGVFTDLQEAITQTGANLVFDITVPEARKQTVITAVHNGCDVFAEKPMAPTPAEADEIEQALKETGRKLFIMQNRRYLGAIRSLRQMIEDGVIGEPGFMTAQFFLGPHFGGFREAMESPLVLDMAIHTFDQARLIAGSDPVSVYCHEFNPPGSWYAGNAAASCIFEFENGLVFSYNGSWCAEGAPTSWESEWRIVGSKGTAIWNGHEAPYAEVADRTQPLKGLFYPVKRIEAPDVWKGRREGHEGCLDEMFAALREEREAETTFTDNRKSLDMVFGAIESAKNGRRVSLKR